MNEERLKMYFSKFTTMTKLIESELQSEANVKGKKLEISGTEFEKKVASGLEQQGFEKKDIYHSPQKFPDFVITDEETGEKIGIEVKKTDSKKWEVIGGSVFESLRNDIEETYVVMAKLGGDKPEVRLRKYAECLADLKVTHSPRFYIDMDLKEGEDYLTTHDAVGLLELEGEELNKKIRQLLRSNKSTWWSEAETTPYSELSKEEKNAYLNDGMALFPEVFGGDYDTFTPWMIYSCLVWCGSIRDIFSAGGNKELIDAGIFVSAIMSRCYENAENIKNRINDMTDEEIVKFWHVDASTIVNRQETWIRLVKAHIRLSSDVIKNNKTKSKFNNKSDSEIEEAVINAFFDAWMQR